MALTLSENLKQRSRQETWLIKIWYEDENTKTYSGSANEFYMLADGDYGSALWQPFWSSGDTPKMPINAFHPDRGFKVTAGGDAGGTDGGFQLNGGTWMPIEFMSGVLNLKAPRNTGAGVGAYTGISSSFSTYSIQHQDPYFSFGTSPYHDDDGIYYYPTIKNISAIKDSIDLKKSKSKTSNITIELINNYIDLDKDTNEMINTQRSLRWADLMFSPDRSINVGTQIMNRKVEIFSVVHPVDNSSLSATPTDFLGNTMNSLKTTMHQIYTGKVSSISLAGGVIKLGVVSMKPETEVFVPNEASYGVMKPIAYGQFTHNTTSNLYSYKYVHPVPYAFSTGNFDSNYYKLPVDQKDSASSWSGASSSARPHLHYYDKANDRFYPLLDQSNNYLFNLSSDDNCDYYIADAFYRKRIKVKMNMGVDQGTDTPSESEGWYDGSRTNPEIVNSHYTHIYDNPTINEDISNYAQAYYFINFNVSDGWGFQVSMSSAGSHKFPAKLTIGVAWEHKVDGNITMKTTASRNAIWYVAHPSNPSGWFNSPFGGNNVSDMQGIFLISKGATSPEKTLVDGQSNSDQSYSGTPYTTSKTISASDWGDLTEPELAFGMPEYSITANGWATGDYTYYCTCRVHDFVMDLKTEIDQDETDREQEIKRIDTLYCPADGTKQAWNGTATNCDLPHQMHRDLLYREAGITTEPEGWSDLETARSTWGGRFWLEKEKDLDKVLQQLQFEGGFIYRYNAQGDLSYIFIKDSYSETDIEATLLENDMANFKMSVTKAKDMLTKIILKSDKHPAKNEYLSKSEFTDTSSRTKYNIQTKENIMTKNIDCGSNVASKLGNYLLKQNSTPRYQISFDILNPEYFGLEAGDIIQIRFGSRATDEDGDFLDFNPWEKGQASSLRESSFGFGISYDTGSKTKFSQLYFMITALNRTMDKLSISATEVFNDTT